MGSMEIIDSHCHLDVPAFDADRGAVLQHARDSGVSGIVVPGVTAAGWEGLWAMCAGEVDLYPALGLHPVYLDTHTPADLERLRAWLAEIPSQKRQEWADALLGDPAASDMEMSAEIAAGRGCWRTMYPQRETAVKVLGRSQTLLARETLRNVERSARWSLSSAKRKLAKLAKRVLVLSEKSEQTSLGRDGDK